VGSLTPTLLRNGTVVAVGPVTGLGEVLVSDVKHRRSGLMLEVEVVRPVVVVLEGLVVVTGSLQSGIVFSVIRVTGREGLSASSAEPPKESGRS